MPNGSESAGGASITIAGPKRIGLSTQTKERLAEFTATFDPKSAASGASVQILSVPNGFGQAVVSGAVQIDAQAGTAKFKVKGTGISTAEDDLIVKVQSGILAPAQSVLTVVYPVTISTPRPMNDQTVPSTPTRQALNSTTVPAAPDVDATHWRLITSLAGSLSVQVVDVFAKPLEGYDGEDVYEKTPSGFKNLNVKLHDKGKYTDNIGLKIDEYTAGANPTADATVRDNWLNGAPGPVPVSSQLIPKDIRIIPSNDQELIDLTNGQAGVDGGTRSNFIDASELKVRWP